MARKGQIREEEIARAKQLRYTAKSVAEPRLWGHPVYMCYYRKSKLLLIKPGSQSPH